MSQLYIDENLVRIQPLIMLKRKYHTDANGNAEVNEIRTKINMSLFTKIGGHKNVEYDG